MMMDGQRSLGNQQQSSGLDKGTVPQTPKENYRLLKKRFKFLVFENECYQEELRNLQRKLLKLSRDKNFLLDRLMLYEKLSDSSDESDSSSHTKPEEKDKKPPKKRSRPAASRKKPEKKDPAVIKSEDPQQGPSANTKGKAQDQPPPGQTLGMKECPPEMERLLPDVMAQYRAERSPAQFDHFLTDGNSLIQ